jgi:chromosome partitioning protein
MVDSSKLLRSSEVAEKLGVDTGTVSRYIREGVIPAISTSGGHYRVYESDLDAFLAGKTKEEGAVAIALVNQKGGVGKTTATANLAVLLSKIGLRVLAVDLDPQGHLTWSLGHNPDTLEYTIYNAMVEERNFDPSVVILKTTFGPDLAPNNILSSDSEEYLRGKPTWGTRLAKVLKRVRPEYDYILMDSGPNLGLLTINCLHAADYVLIPTQLEILSVKGLQLLLRRVEETREENPRLQVAGAFGMMVQPINASRAVDESLRAALAKRGIRVFNTQIKRSAQFSDIANRGEVLVTATPRSEHAQAYQELLGELLRVVGGPGLSAVSRVEAHGINGTHIGNEEEPTLTVRTSPARSVGAREENDNG